MDRRCWSGRLFAPPHCFPPTDLSPPTADRRAFSSTLDPMAQCGMLLSHDRVEKTGSTNWQSNACPNGDMDLVLTTLPTSCGKARWESLQLQVPRFRR